MGGGRPACAASLSCSCTFCHTRSATLTYARDSGPSGWLKTMGTPPSPLSRIAVFRGICARGRAPRPGLSHRTHRAGDPGTH